jgi:hypothetical protein
LGVFVSMFAIVVTLSGGAAQAAEADDPWTAALLVIGAAATVAPSILVMLMGNKFLSCGRTARSEVTCPRGGRDALR